MDEITKKTPSKPKLHIDVQALCAYLFFLLQRDQEDMASKYLIIHSGKNGRNYDTKQQFL